MKLKKYAIVMTLLFIIEISTVSYLYIIENKKNNYEIDNLSKSKNILNQNKIEFRSLENQCNSLEKNINDEEKQLENVKIVYDLKKLKAYTGYTVNSYSTRKGNHTNTRNYIKVH